MYRRVCCLAICIAALTPAAVVGATDRIRRAQTAELTPAEATNPARIVGGTPVTSKDDFPFFCVTDPFSCGCALVAPDMLLTAAHCASAFLTGRTIHIGGLQLDGSDAEDSRVVAERFPHPSFSNVMNGDDVMMVRLTQSSTVTSFASMNFNDNLPQDGDDVVAIGHGTTREGGLVSDVLLQVEVPVVPFATCNSRSYYDGDVIDDAMICAGEAGLDACQGDSGGMYEGISHLC